MLLALDFALRQTATMASLERLAQVVLSSDAVFVNASGLSLPQTQLLVAVVDVAEPDEKTQSVMRMYGGNVNSMWIFNGAAASASMADVLAGVGATEPGPRLTAIVEIVEQLIARLVLWPVGAGRLPSGLPATVGLPAPLMEMVGRVKKARSADHAMTSAFNRPEVARIAERLGVGDETASRDALQAAVVEALSDAGTLTGLVERAPHEVRNLVQRMIAVGGRMSSNAFRQLNGYGAKWYLDRQYPDPATLWLAEHGLVTPAGPQAVELPSEVQAILGGGVKHPLTLSPPELVSQPVEASRVRADAQSAILSAVRKVGRVLESFDASPVVLRKAGGMPVRETRRLAKLAGVDEIEARFWIDLAAAAGLLAAVDGTDVVVHPTDAFDRWQAGTPAQRVAPLIDAWWRIDSVLTVSAEPGQAPTPFHVIAEPRAAAIRRASLNALGGLPDDRAWVMPARPVVRGQLTESDVDAITSLANTASFYAPTAIGSSALGPWYALHSTLEAELLGLAAMGALSPVGRALVASQDVEAALAEILPEERSTARFQADLTAIVGGTPSAALAGLLDSVADRESEGHATVWRLSVRTVRRALDGGRDTEELLADLRRVAEPALPQPIDYLIRDVARAHGKMRVVRSACCVRSDDQSLLDELAHAKPLAKLALRRIAPTVLISVKPPAETLAALRTAGYSPVLEAETGATVVERAAGRRAPAMSYTTFGVRSAMTPDAALAMAKSLLTP